MLASWITVIGCQAPEPPPSNSEGPLDPSRVALVVGNLHYEHAPDLPHVYQDARRVAGALRGVGFQVTEVHDLDRDSMNDALSAFEAASVGAEVGVLYYAGHAVTLKRRNYLVPVDAVLDLYLPFEGQTVAVDRVVRHMQAAQALVNLLVLDASRPNPWGDAWTKVTYASARERKGLAFVGPPEGFVVMTPAPVESVAHDVGGFADALATHLGAPCSTVPDVATRTRAEVLRRTAGIQRPLVVVGDGAAVHQRTVGRCAATPPEQGPVASSGSLTGSGRVEYVWVPEVGPTGLYVGRTEITQEQWARVMGDTPSQFRWCGSDCPVERVSWMQAVTFANACSTGDGLTHAYAVQGDQVTWDRSADGYRLLTPQEWEAAARAGQSFRFSGSDDVSEVGWVGHEDVQGTPTLTHPVCTKRPNARGLCDMTGNVWEWVFGARSAQPRYKGGASLTRAPQAEISHDPPGFAAGHSDWNIGLRLARPAPL